MIRIFCDKCGCEITNNPLNVDINIYEVDVGADHTDHYCYELDICERCQRNLLAEMFSTHVAPLINPYG